MTSSDDEELTENQILKALAVLESKFKIDESNRRRESTLKAITSTDFLRLLSVYRYLKAELHKRHFLPSSTKVAAAFYQSRNQEWTTPQIIIWSEIIQTNHLLPEKNQGCHIKIKAIISGENTQSFCRQWLRSQKAHPVSGLSFSERIKHQLHIEFELPTSVEISERQLVGFIS